MSLKFVTFSQDRVKLKLSVNESLLFKIYNNYTINCGFLPWDWVQLKRDIYGAQGSMTALMG